MFVYRKQNRDSNPAVSPAVRLHVSLKAKTRAVTRVFDVLNVDYCLTGPCAGALMDLGVTIALKRKTVCFG